MIAGFVRHLTWRRRVRAARGWRAEQRAEYDAAIRRILDQAVLLRQREERDRP